MENKFQVVVGNVGTVYDGDDFLAADAVYETYAAQATQELGRAANEPVTLLANGEELKSIEAVEVIADATDILYEWSMVSGQDEEVGSCTEGNGWSGLFRWTENDTVKYPALRGYVGGILHEDTQGFKDSTLYETEDELNAAWSDHKAETEDELNAAWSDHEAETEDELNAAWSDHEAAYGTCEEDDELALMEELSDEETE